MRYCGIKEKHIVLKSVLFLLVMICLLTTPTRAYEAYTNSNLIVLKKMQLNQEQELKNFLPLTNKPTPKNTEPDAADVCGKAALKAEQDYQIKQNLLQTIASVESGRYDKNLKKRIAWPWTVHANGQGYYYNTKAEAIVAIEAFQAQGINNIDVGCMQINLKYHGKAFHNLQEALDPEKNVAYSAEFLLNLYQKNGHSWQKTAMQYHSKNHTLGLNYKTRLEKHYAQYINSDNTQTLF